MRHAHHRWSLLHGWRHWWLRESIGWWIKIASHGIVRRIPHERHGVGCHHPRKIVTHHLLLGLRLEVAIIHGLLRSCLIEHLSSLHVDHHLLGKDILLLLVHILYLVSLLLHVLLVILAAFSLGVGVQSIVLTGHEDAIVIEEGWFLCGFAHAEADDD